MSYAWKNDGYPDDTNIIGTPTAPIEPQILVLPRHQYAAVLPRYQYLDIFLPGGNDRLWSIRLERRLRDRDHRHGHRHARSPRLTRAMASGLKAYDMPANDSSRTTSGDIDREENGTP
jgi:hypothetical protein